MVTVLEKRGFEKKKAATSAAFVRVLAFFGYYSFT